MHFGYFFLKEIFFIEKQHNGGGCKVLVIADTVEQVQALVHSVLLGIKVSVRRIIICKTLTLGIIHQAREVTSMFGRSSLTWGMW